jgi:hypothetical protein
MKTSSSVDDALLHEPDEAARQIGVSRRRLFGWAIASFADQRRREHMFQQLNEAYESDPQAGEKQLTGAFKRRARGVVGRDCWSPGLHREQATKSQVYA